ncbi:unnamed protein product [Dibothriocephalus latus]|uniref:Uncharacterized protein n=1 Tax=Dibothriocephalus latus TaxID=60516 RepID=A0A3P7NXH7_DIBLA|nr:unnamed protein product [Dibothriocephalus latus]
MRNDRQEELKAGAHTFGTEGHNNKSHRDYGTSCYAAKTSQKLSSASLRIRRRNFTQAHSNGAQRDNEKKDRLTLNERSMVSSLLMAHRPRDALAKSKRKALRELRADSELVIVPTEKERPTVIFDMTDYIQKAQTFLDSP